MQSMDSDFYCSTCKIDCINCTEKLLHVLTEKHCVLFELRQTTQGRKSAEIQDTEERNCQKLIVGKLLDKSVVPIMCNVPGKSVVFKETKPKTKCTRNELSEGNMSTNSMKNDFFCNLCSVDCVDSTGKLLHALTVEHCITYKSKMEFSFQDDQTNRENEKQNFPNKMPEFSLENGSQTKKTKKNKHKGKNISKKKILVDNLNIYSPTCSLSKVDKEGTFDMKTIANMNQESIFYPSSRSEKSSDSFHGKDKISLEAQGNIFYHLREHRSNEYCTEITVKGISTGFNMMMMEKYFLKYGLIKVFEVIGYLLWIEYFDWKSVEKVYADVKENKIIINDQEFEIVRNTFKFKKDFQVVKIPSDIKDIFSSREQFEKKVNSLLLDTEFNLDEVNRQNDACNSVVECLKHKFDPTAHTFGSRVIGIATKKSDLDIHLDISHPPELIKNIYKNSTQKNIVLHVGKILRDCTEFGAVVPIVNAKTPIVKCLHKPTGIQCDLSFGVPYGLYTTSLIKFCLSLDYRVKPLIVFIQYWSSELGFLAKGRISNHCIVLMIIFYLQQIPIEPVLPNVASLIGMAIENEKRTVGFWECGYGANASSIPKTANKTTFLQLLYGFFKFYFEFDASNVVISSYLGDTVEKRLFLPGMESELPKLFAQYASNINEHTIEPFATDCVLCVQDPFVHNHNVTQQIRSTIFLNFKRYCGIFADVCDSVSKVASFSDACESFIQERFNVKHL